MPMCNNNSTCSCNNSISFEPKECGSEKSSCICTPGKSVLDEWREKHNRPDATLDDLLDVELRGKVPEVRYPQIVFKATIKDIRPDAPDPVTLEGWTEANPGVSQAYKYLWTSNRYKTDTTNPIFSPPALLSVYTEDGEKGEDGSKVEFIFKLFTTEDGGQAPESRDEVDFVPAGWSDEPIGPTTDLPYELHCMRTNNTGTWSQFSKPSIWARFSTDGRPGQNGQHAETIYTRTANEGVVPKVPVSENTDKYLPAGFTDVPVSVNEDLKVQWGLTRSKVGNTWGAFSKPFIYTQFVMDGRDGKDVEYIFKRSKTFATPSTPIAPGLGDESFPSGWTDDSLGISAEWPFEYRSMRKRNQDNSWGQYTEPKLFSKWAEDGIIPQQLFCRTATNQRPTTPVDNSNNDKFIPAGWTLEPADVTDDMPYGWTIVRSKVLNVWTVYSTPALIFKYGKNGSDGIDGNNYEFIYKLTLENQRPPIPVSKQEDDFVPDGWSDDAEDVSDTFPYVWRSYRKKVNGIHGDFSFPRLVYVKGMDGADGKDGRDYEFIFKRTKIREAPSTPESIDEDDFIPEGWTDDALGVDAEFPFEWRCQRIRENSEWGVYKDPKLIHIKGMDGKRAPITAFRGNWDKDTTYIGSEDLAHIVLYNKFYYIAQPDAGSFKGIAPVDSEVYWKKMDEYENIATGFLFADSAAINDLTVTKLRTGLEGKRIEINADGEHQFVITHDNGLPGIVIKTMEDGLAAIVINNANGVPIATLGSNGLEVNQLYPELWKEYYVKPISNLVANSVASLTDAQKSAIFTHVKDNTCTANGPSQFFPPKMQTFYLSGCIKVHNYTKGNYASGVDDSMYEGFHTSAEKLTTNFINDGWYIRDRIMYTPLPSNNFGVPSVGGISGYFIIKVVGGKVVYSESIYIPDPAVLNLNACPVNYI